MNFFGWEDDNKPDGGGVVLDPEKRINILIESGFAQAYEMASRGSCCKEHGMDMLDRRSMEARRLLKRLDSQKKEKYDGAITQKYYDTLSKISSIRPQEDLLPHELNPGEIIESAMNFGFANSVRIASFSYERGRKMFDNYSERAYSMMKRLAEPERENYRRLLDESYDIHFMQLLNMADGSGSESLV